MQILSTPAVSQSANPTSLPASLTTASLAAPTPATSAQSAATLLAQSTVYSTTIGGHEYTADISQSAGNYVATIPNQLPPITATGSSLVLAESNLESTISLLV
jgi:hypothetical protein